MTNSYLIVFGVLSWMVRVRGACDTPFWLYKRLNNGTWTPCVLFACSLSEKKMRRLQKLPILSRKLSSWKYRLEGEGGEDCFAFVYCWYWKWRCHCSVIIQCHSLKEFFSWWVRLCSHDEFQSAGTLRQSRVFTWQPGSRDRVEISTPVEKSRKINAWKEFNPCWKDLFCTFAGSFFKKIYVW